MEFAYNNSYHTSIQMAPYEALYGRRCRSPIHWSEVGEKKVLIPEILDQTVEVIGRIHDKIRIAQERQKKYADIRRKDLEFDIGEKVFLKVAPIKGIIRFGKRGKLKPRYIGPFEILERIGAVAYRLALPPDLSAVHNVFHISMLKKYVPDPSHVIDFEELKVGENLMYEEKPIAILGKKIHKLRNREIPLVLVQWVRHGREEATWEREEEILAKYPEVFI